MAYLADFIQVGIIILGLIGLSLAGKYYLPTVDYGLHFCFTPLLVVATLFCLEHFLPLGQMPFLWVPGCALSVWLIYKNRGGIIHERVIWYFLFGFGVCFFWRFMMADIHPNSERIADHAHLVSYSAGGLLPADDIWLKGNKDNMYYIFQYYGTGLIHRWTGASSGMTFQMGYCVMMGLAIAGVGVGVRALAQSTWAGIWAVVCIALGGSGTTLVASLMVPGDIDPAQAMRFIGSFAMLGNPFLTQFGKDLVHFIGESPVDAPMEYYSYLIMLGDFHPSLSSLFFFGLGIGAIGVAERAPAGSATDRYALIAGTSTAVFLLISNTWIAPLQAALMICWMVYRRFTSKQDSFRDIFIAWAVPFILIAPFFLQFAYETRYYHVTIKWVEQRAPLFNWMLVMGPALLMWVACLWQGFRSRFGIFVIVLTAGAIVGTYILYASDNYGGPFAIFNSTLKWWPWAYALTICLGISLCWQTPILRKFVIFIVLLTLVGNFWIFGRYLYFQPMNHVGRLDGYAWFTDVPEQRAIFEILKASPQGVVMESLPQDAAGPCQTVAQFSEHYSLGGWVGHEMLWRGARMDLVNIWKGRDEFYDGKMVDPLNWLKGITAGGVDYIVWLGRDNARAPDNWEHINAQISQDYAWKQVRQVNTDHWGIWIKKEHH